MRVFSKVHCCTCRKEFTGWKDGNKIQACCSTECLIEAKNNGVQIDEEGARTVYRPLVWKHEKFKPSGVKSKKKKQKRNVYREVHEKALAFAGVVERDDYYDDE